MKLSTAIGLLLLWGWEEASGWEDGSGREDRNVTVYKETVAGDLEGVNLHSRRKRYIVFPKGSSLQLILEHLVHVPSQFRVVVGPTLQVAWPLPSDSPESFRSKRSLPEVAGRRRDASHSQRVFAIVDDHFSRKESLAGDKYRVLREVGTLLDLFGMTVGLAWQLPDDPMIYSELKKNHKIYKRNVLKKMETFIDKPLGANGRDCVLRALCESGQRTPSKKEFLTEILHKIFSVEAEEQDLEENSEDKLYRKAHQSLNQNCKALYPKCHFSLFDAE